MKKMFFVIVAFLCATQIVKASDVKDATLRKKGTQTEASTIDWLRSEKPDVSIIHMSIKQFNAGFKACLVEFNNKYKSFPEINSDVINDEIIPALYTKELTPGKLYTFSYWNATTQTWHRWQRMAKPGETGLFYKGWDDDPIMSVYCWNFGYPTTEKVVAPKVEKPETEIVILPGTNKYFYKTDTIRERNDTYKEVQNNFFLKTDNNTFAKSSNQSFIVNMEPEAKEVSSKSCDCPSPKREVTYAKERSCGCDEDHICQDHYKRLPKKVKKRFGDRTWVRIGTHILAFAAGWGLNEWLDKDDNIVTGRVFTQGPVDPLPARVITQGPLNLFQ